MAPLISFDGLTDAFMGGFYPDGECWKTPEAAFERRKSAASKSVAISSAPASRRTSA